jgi:hypothetical protein
VSTEQTNPNPAKVTVTDMLHFNRSWAVHILVILLPTVLLLVALPVVVHVEYLCQGPGTQLLVLIIETDLTVITQSPPTTPNAPFFRTGFG